MRAGDPAVVAQAAPGLPRAPVRGGVVHAAVGGDPGPGAADHEASGGHRGRGRGREPGGRGGRPRPRVSWPTAHRALVAAAARWLPAPEPVRVLGIDETRARSVRWVLADAGWKRTDPWLTSFVDAGTTGPGRMLGLAPGRSGVCVKDWLAEQTPAFRDAVQVVVIDTSAPYASGIRAALPGARVAVDKWHLVALANAIVTEIRQRVTRELLGRRGTTAERVWVNRRLLLTGYQHLSTKQAHPI